MNGVGGLLLVVLAATGLVIWWPDAGRFARAWRVDWRAGWKRVIFDLHNALGAWLLVPLLILSITGAYFTWPQTYRDLVSRVAPLSPRTAAPRSTVPAVAGPPVDLDVVIARVRNANPATPAMRVDLPGSPASPYVVISQRHADDGPRDTVTTFVDRYSGAVLAVRRPAATETTGDTIVAWLGPLHTGHFGGPVVKSVWALLGLAPAALATSGAIMWWNRLIVPRRRRAARIAVDA